MISKPVIPQFAPPKIAPYIELLPAITSASLTFLFGVTCLFAHVTIRLLNGTCGRNANIIGKHYSQIFMFNNTFKKIKTMYYICILRRSIEQSYL